VAHVVLLAQLWQPPSHGLAEHYKFVGYNQYPVLQTEQLKPVEVEQFWQFVKLVKGVHVEVPF